MSVRPILLQSDGAIRGIPGAYRTSPPPIAGPYAGSDQLESVTYYTVNFSGEAELVTVKAYPFYVDSVSGGLDTSGEGTPINPWRSMNYALTQIQPILACLSSKSCCTYIVLRVKGTVDYTVQYNGGSEFNGCNRFIIEPWEEFINIGIISDTIKAIFYIEYTIWKNIKISTNGFSEAASPVYNLRGSIFNNIEINTETNPTFNNQFKLYGMFSCDNSIFYKTNINIVKEGNYFEEIRGFFNNPNSIFYESNVDISGIQNAIGLGFFSNVNSAFFTCVGHISEESSYYGCGFLGNTNSAFFNCTGNTVNPQFITCDI